MGIPIAAKARERVEIRRVQRASEIRLIRAKDQAGVICRIRQRRAKKNDIPRDTARFPGQQGIGRMQYAVEELHDDSDMQKTMARRSVHWD